MFGVTDQIPGWYPDPTDPRLVRWFDGRAWTPYTADATDTPTTWGRPAIGREWFTLSAVVQAGLATVVFANAAAVLVTGRTRDVIARAMLTSSPADLRSVTSLAEFARSVQLLIVLAAIATGVAFISWLHRAHRSSAMDTTRMRHGSGWAITSWFVPLVNLWLPYEMVQDVRRGASRTGRDSLLVLVWWVTSLLSATVVAAAWFTRPPAGGTSPADMSALSESGLLAMVGNASNLFAAVLGILVVQQLRADVRTRLTEPLTVPRPAPEAADVPVGGAEPHLT